MNCFQDRKFILFSCLSLYVVSGLADNFWSPFLPTEFSKRGISDTTIGVVIAVFDVACFVTPCLILAVDNVTLNRHSFCLSALTLAISCIAFGQLLWMQSNIALVTASIFFRSLMGIGNALAWCSGATIFLSLYPDDTGKVFSSISAAQSIGMILGTPFGSYFYGLGGYHLPFSILGLSEIVLFGLTYMVLYKGQNRVPDRCVENEKTMLQQHDTSAQMSTIITPKTTDEDLECAKMAEKELVSSGESNKISSVLEFLTNPGVLCLSLQLIIYASTLGFFFVSFGPYLLNAFQIGSQDAGSYFLPFTVVRATSAPFLGYITDQGYAGVMFAVSSAILAVPSFFILGLSGVIESLNNLYLVETLVALIGISSMCCFVSYVPLLRKIYGKREGIMMEVINSQTSALYCVCYGIGMVFGQSAIGGLALQYLGFNNSCFLETLLLVSSDMIGLFYLIRSRSIF